MNKLFTKIATLVLGMTMAVGVGVAVSSGVKAGETQAAGGTFEKITSTADLESGKKYLIVYENGNLAFDGSKTAFDAVGNSKSISISSNKITTTTDFYFTITSKTGGYSLRGSSEYYTGQTTDANGMKTSANDDYTNSISFDSNGNVTIVSGGAYLRYNSASDQTRFRYYKSSSYTNQKAIQLYKESSAATTCEITLNPNGGSGGTTTVTATKGQTMPTLATAPTRSGYAFAGYYDESTGGTQYYTETKASARNWDKDGTTATLYAHWTAVYTVTYVKGDHGSGADHKVNNVKAGSYSLITFAAAGFTADSGYGFTKWKIGDNLYDAGASVTISDNTTVTAQYAEIVTLTYDKNGGTGTNVVQNIAKGSSVTVVDCTFTAPTGKAFSKWNTKSDGTGTSYVKDDSFTINANTTLYAQWSPVMDITLSNWNATGNVVTAITNSYTTTAKTNLPAATHNSSTTVSLEGYGVYSNNPNIQMNSGKGTYIKNTTALPMGAYITKIETTWGGTSTQKGNATPKIYMSKGSVASTSSTLVATATGGANQTWTVSDAASCGYNYFYFDGGDNLGGACYLTSMKICYDFKDELQSIQVNATQAQLTYTVGDTFNFAGSVTPTRLLSGAGEPTTDNLTFKLGGVSITAGSYKFVKSDHGKTLNVTYTESGVSKNANAPFAMIVNYEVVTSITLNLSSTSIGLEGEVDLEATIESEYADPTVLWGVSSSEQLVEDVNYEYIYDGNVFSLSMIEGNESVGTITVTATATGYIDDTQTPNLRATCVITVAGAKSVSLSVDSLSGYAGSGNNHRGSITATANNFLAPTYTWSIVSESVAGMITFTTSTSATTYVNYVKAGTATIRCGAQENGAGDFTYSDTITVAVAEDTVISVSWDGDDFTCYSGIILSPSTISSWMPTYTMQSGDTGSITSNYIFKLNGVAFTPGTALEAGIYVGTLTYGGVTTTANNPKITVIQRLNTITYEESGTYSWVATSGDHNTISAAGASGNFVLEGQTWTINRDNTSTTNMNKDCVQIGANGSATSFTLTTNFGLDAVIEEVAVEASSYQGKHTIGVTVGGTSYVSTQSTASWETVSEVKGTGTSKGNVVITYTAGSDARAAYIKSVTIKWSSSSNIANLTSHYSAQAAVVEFAQYMNTQMNDTNVCTGDMSKLGTAWSNVTSKYNSLFGASTLLNPTELAYAKKMLSAASANWDESHDSNELYCLERAMKTYEWCVSHYSGTCNAFMSTVRPVEHIQTNPISVFGTSENGNMVAIVVIVSVVSLTAIGGYFFLKKRREQN